MEDCDEDIWRKWMHILFVADSDTQYRAGNSMLGLIRELHNQDGNLQISVVLPVKSDLRQSLRDIGCNVYIIPYIPFYQSFPYQKWEFPIKLVVRFAQYWYGRFFAEKYLSKKMEIDSVDSIHSNSSREDFSAQLTEKYQKPLIWHIREFGDLDYVCFSLRKKHIEYMNLHAEEFIAVFDAVKKYWIKKGLDKKRIKRIYNGVCDNVKVKEHYEENSSDFFRFVIMGSVCETKGQYQIIEAISLLPLKVRKKIKLDIVGGGRDVYLWKLQKQIKDRKLEGQIRLLGYQRGYGRKLDEYNCGVMCSASEGFDRVTVEYMMSSLPVIASNTGANPELIMPYETGLLYRWNDFYDLKDKIMWIYENKEKAFKMGKYARSIALKKFSARENARLIVLEYKKVLGGVRWHNHDLILCCLTSKVIDYAA